MRSDEIRARLDFPIIDVDGHQTPIEPGFEDYLRKEGGSEFAERYRARMAARFDPRSTNFFGAELDWYDMSPEERRDRRARRGGWWGSPARNTLDRATSVLPKLLYERLDEFGLDYTILYAGGLFDLLMEPEEEIRRVTVRAMNSFQADLYRGYVDRMTVAASIPMGHPQEAIDELEYAVCELGLKVIAITPGVQRPIPELDRRIPEASPEANWFDSYGLDSAHDYDPFWARCVELKVAVTSHGGMVPGMPYHGRSISSFVFNHVGTHAYQQSLLCKSLFLGGVTRRFPELNFAFLECGVGFACSLYAELISHWAKRNRTVIDDLNPANIDRESYLDLVARYGSERLRATLDQIRSSLEVPGPDMDEAMLDEWSALEIASPEDLRELFTRRFYFGCEADDPINAWAFRDDINPMDARMKIALSSDISHWDVPDMSKVVEEAYSLVETGKLGELEFKEFACTNAVRLHAGMNPDFFKGTVCEQAAEQILKDVG